MKTLTDLFASKKFIVLLLTVIGALISAATNAVTWPDALEACLAAVGVYIGAQGMADGLSGGMTSSQPDTPSSKDLPTVVKNP